jgi:hypothetical protein
MTRARAGALAVVILLALGLVAVLASGGQSASTAISTPMVAATAPAWRRDSVYLPTVRARGFDGETDGALISTARNVCDYIDQGRGLLDLVAYVQQRHDVSAQDAAYLIGAGVRVYCPQHSEAFTPQG